MKRNLCPQSYVLQFILNLCYRELNHEKLFSSSYPTPFHRGKNSLLDHLSLCWKQLLYFSKFTRNRIAPMERSKTVTFKQDLCFNVEINAFPWDNNHSPLVSSESGVDLHWPNRSNVHWLGTALGRCLSPEQRHWCPARKAQILVRIEQQV